METIARARELIRFARLYIEVGSIFRLNGRQHIVHNDAINMDMDTNEDDKLPNAPAVNTEYPPHVFLSLSIELSQLPFIASFVTFVNV